MYHKKINYYHINCKTIAKEYLLYIHSLSLPGLSWSGSWWITPCYNAYILLVLIKSSYNVSNQNNYSCFFNSIHFDQLNILLHMYIYFFAKYILIIYLFLPLIHISTVSPDICVRFYFRFVWVADGKLKAILTDRYPSPGHIYLTRISRLHLLLLRLEGEEL